LINSIVVSAKAKLHTLPCTTLKKALFISAFFIGFLPSSVSANSLYCPSRHITQTAAVRYVHDGDTLKLNNNTKIRLLGIDTPELARQHQATQPFAQQAKRALQKLVEQNQDHVGLVGGIEKFDKYHRRLAHLYLSNGDSIQAHLLRLGLATAYTTPPNIRLNRCYQQAEAFARQQKLGIWSLPQYQIKSLPQLTKKDSGFRRIKGRISRAYPTKNGFWIVLGNKLRIQIRQRDLVYFKPQELQQLIGKSIQIRGWLHPNKRGFYMNLRHPDNFSVKQR